MKLSKRLGSVIIAIAMLASSMAAFACANDQFIAYDQYPDKDGNYAKLFYCLDKNAIVVNGYADKAEWKPVFFEAEYPHREIEALFLDGINTGMTRYVGNNAEVNVKEVPEFWEAKVPYFVYNRLYSDFTGKFEPTNTLKTNFKSAPVAKEWVKKGFGPYVVENGVAKDYSLIYKANAGQVDVTLNQINELKAKFDAAIASGVDALEASKIFENAINNVSWLKLTGPDYVTGGDMVIEPMAKIAAGANAEWYDDLVACDTPATKDVNYLNVDYQNENTADISWETIGFELKAPYRVYQVLCVDGVAMDGSEIELVGSTEIVDKKVGEVENTATKIQLVKKAVDLVDYSTSTSKDYVVDPFETEELTTVVENETYKVDQDPKREEILDVLMTPDGVQYEVRIVEEVVEPGKTNLPYIFRYNGFAQPTIEWKTAFAEAAYPFEIYEEKFVNGIATGEYRTTGRYAEPKFNLDQTIGQPRVLTVMLEDNADVAKIAWELEGAGYSYKVGDGRIYVVVPGEVYKGFQDFGKFEADVKTLVNSLKVDVVE